MSNRMNSMGEALQESLKTENHWVQRSTDILGDYIFYKDSNLVIKNIEICPDGLVTKEVSLNYNGKKVNIDIGTKEAIRSFYIIKMAKDKDHTYTVIEELLS